MNKVVLFILLFVLGIFIFFPSCEGNADCRYKVVNEITYNQEKDISFITHEGNGCFLVNIIDNNKEELYVITTDCDCNITNQIPY